MSVPAAIGVTPATGPASRPVGTQLIDDVHIQQVYVHELSTLVLNAPASAWAPAYVSPSGGVTGTSSTTMFAAPGAGRAHRLASITVQNCSTATRQAVTVSAGSDVLLRFDVMPGQVLSWPIHGPGLVAAANQPITIAFSATGKNNVHAQAYTVDV